MAILVALLVTPGAAAEDKRELAVISGSNPALLRIMKPDGTPVRTIVSRPSNVGFPSWSPDEKTLAYFESGKVLLQPAIGGPEKTLTAGGQPAWSPTHDEIAYWTWTSPSRSLRVIGADGSNDRLIAGPFNNHDGMPAAWSPDGATLAFGLGGSIVSVPAAGGGSPTTIASPGAGELLQRPAYSPDGTRISYVRFLPQPQGATVRPDQLVVRPLASGPEFVVVNHPSGKVGMGSLASPSWSADSERIAYIEDDFNYSPAHYRLATIGADGSARTVLLEDTAFVNFVSWANAPRPPVVTIQAPKPGAKLTGREKVGAAEQQLTFRVESLKSLAGVCFAVQTAPTPVPDEQSCTNASGPTGAPFQYTTDLRPLVDAGTIKAGDNTVRVWAYDQDGARGSAEVKIVLDRASYFIKHVEVAQALSPPFGTPPAADPLQPAAYVLPWTIPSLAGFEIPLIAGRSTVLRIYVGDAKLDAGTTDTASIHYRVAAGVATEESDQTVVVTAADVAPNQADTTASINVWLPGSVASSASTLTVGVEVNAGEAMPECSGCFPNGNRATVSGIAFKAGGTVELRPVPILLIDAAGSILAPDADYAKVLPDAQRYLPVADGGVAVAPAAGSVVATLAELTAVAAANPADKYARCAFLYNRVKVLRAVSAVPTGERWVGTASPPAYIGCNGIADVPGATILLNRTSAETLAHEFGHSVGVDHTLSLVGAPAGAAPLPYVGLGAFGYSKLAAGVDIYDAATTSDIMGYAADPRWTSPATWSRMHQGIVGGVGSLRNARAAAARVRGRAAANTAGRRLVSGYISGDRGVIFSSLVAQASRPDSAGPVAGRVVALDRRGRAIASANVTGNPIDEDGAGPVIPFVIALPPTATAASLALRAPNGKRLASLRRSRHRPSARFVRLARRTSARGRLTVRWKAADRDRDRLTVTLLARRGKKWQTIALGPAAYAAAVEPSTLGRGKRLRLRMLVSDGFNTTKVDAKPVIVR